MPKYSVVVPVFKREDEVRELLDSLSFQIYPDFEIILVDGSPTNDLSTIDNYVAQNYSKLDFHRIYSRGLGISDSRNLGAEKARGEYLIFLDSDVILPEDYFSKIETSLSDSELDAFGGPDAAHSSFSDVQKAISFSMTSFITTGGIRGGRRHVGQFKPRGFNMGVKQSVFEKLEGFNANLPVGEDMDLSARIIEAGYRTGLIPEAHVFHKRRVSISKFYKQVFRFGAARVMLSKMHSGEMKLTHLFPLVFSFYLIGALLALLIPISIIQLWPLSLLGYLILVFLISLFNNKSLKVAGLSVITTITQFLGYASGFLKNGYAVWFRGKENGIFDKKEGEPESPL